jgi:hypothetical protein
MANLFNEWRKARPFIAERVFSIGGQHLSNLKAHYMLLPLERATKTKMVFSDIVIARVQYVKYGTIGAICS